MRRKTYTSILKIFLLGCVLTTYQTSFALEDIAEIVVTASRIEEPLSQVGSQVSILTNLEIKARQFTGVLEALGTMSGVTINQTGSFGGAASVRIRGAASEQTLILIDNVEVNDTSSPGGGFDFSSLSLWDVEQIEVIKGPQSTLYGSDAIGGVINIITKSGKEGFEGNLWMEAGSYKTGRGGATLKGGGNKIKYRLSASGTRTDGISKADVRDGNTEKDGFTNFQFSGNLKVKVTKNFHLFATGRYGESDTEFDIFGLPTGVMDGDDNTKSKDYSFDSGAKFFTVGDKFSGNIGVQKSNLNRNNLSNGLPSFSSEGSRTKIYGNGVIRTGILDTILLGFESEKTKTSGTFSTLTHQRVNALFGHIQDEILPSLTVTFGLRYDSFSTEAPTSILSSNKINYLNASNRATNRTTLNYHFRNSDAILRASFGTGFKTPSIFQTTFFCCGAKEVNPNLKPETSKGWDIGIEKPLNDNTTFHLSYHWQSIENLIDFSFPDGGYLNISKAKTSGLEATINYAKDVFHMGMNYTYSKAINVLLGSRLLRVPTHEIGLNIAYDISKVTSLGTSLIYRSDQLDINGTIEGAAVLDVRGSQRISEYLEFYARIENLLDQHYQTVFGYGTPGLSGYMGLRARF